MKIIKTIIVLMLILFLEWFFISFLNIAMHNLNSNWILPSWLEFFK